MKKRLCVILAVLFVCPIAALAQTLIANFDSFEEGAIGYTFQDGGITFSELDTYSPSFPPPCSFSIENASGDSNFSGLLTSPNCLSFFGYAPGPFGSWSRFGSVHISFEGRADNVSLDIFMFSDADIKNNRLTLQAFLEGSLVAEDILLVPTTVGPCQMQMGLSDILFDDLKLVSSGPSLNGAVMIAMDNVHITLIPEPCSLSFFIIGVMLATGKRK